ncbi:Retrovirus-related Pol polyprotein from transposon 17.6 [Araneus ventricosus]|uniref:Retrovirus-related Pol polyprotein from transposon 17.6 n=1 Tax=Araneus ventricosus TaxID=182803 RepID=A0A4Y2U0J4_ARAVE|nr:Retrovirus-related Pol polyprotein from transposon 17.6 [Araneus ventricosus]
MDIVNPMALFRDASDYAVGSILQQLEEDSWKPLAFFSKKLTNAQEGYSTYDREPLGIYLSIKQVKHILEGRQFTIYTDHKPLMFAFQQKNEKASLRQLRHLQYISEISTDIRHIDGKENIVADSLSRIESVSAIDYNKISDTQIDNKDLDELHSKPSLHFKQYHFDSVVKRHDKHFTVTIKGKDINISVGRLKPAYLLLTEVDAPHSKKLDTAPTLPNENQTAHEETEKQQSDLLEKDVQKKTTLSG